MLYVSYQILPKSCYLDMQGVCTKELHLKILHTKHAEKSIQRQRMTLDRYYDVDLKVKQHCVLSYVT